MNLSIFRFKPDQGRLARGAAFWLTTALVFYGCQTLYLFLQWGWAQEKLVEWEIPVFNLPVNLALIISVVVFLGFETLLLKLINSVKLGTLLIETETEMKKVTWPSVSDSFNSSMVVLIAVIFFMLFLGISDIVLHFIFKDIIFGR